MMSQSTHYGGDWSDWDRAPHEEVMWHHSTMRPEGDLSRVRRNRDTQKKAMPKIYEIGAHVCLFAGGS